MSAIDVLITGTGCVSPFGSGVDAFWKGLSTGRACGPPTTFSASGSRASGVYEIPEGVREQRDFPRVIAARAAAEALRSSGLDHSAVQAGGLALASTSAGWQLPAEAFGEQPPSDPRHLRKEWPAIAVADELGITGPCAITSSACASSIDALAWAAEQIRVGHAEVMLVGAVDVLTEVVFAGFHAMRLLSPTSTRPFAQSRDGFVLAEGAAFLVLESAEHARTHSSQALAVLQGWGASSDAVHVTTPDGDGIARAWYAALADAELDASAISVVHAHGTASQASDRAEIQAVRTVFGKLPRSPRIAAIKSALGHTEGAAGLFSILAAVEGVRRGELPPAVDATERVTDSATRFGAASDVPTAPTELDPVLVHSSGFGGANSTVILGRDTRPRGRARSRAVRLLAISQATDSRLTTANFDGSEPRSAEPLQPRWPRNPPPDRLCTALAEALGAMLGAAPAALRSQLRSGGLITGTEFGAQEHHASIHRAIRSGGLRSVNPMDFALSTFNAAASMAGTAHAIRGQSTTFLGTTSGIEALLSATNLIAIGRAEAILAAAYDHPANQLWRQADSTAVAPQAVVVSLEAADHADVPGHRVIASRRLPARVEPIAFEELARAVLNLAGEGERVWVTGLDDADATKADREGWIIMPTDAGAAAPLAVHGAAVASLAGAQSGGVLVASTGRYAATLLVRYGWSGQ